MLLQLLEAYLLQGLPGPALCGKVLACFKDSINDAAMRLMRSMVLGKAAFSGDGSSSPSSSGSSARSSYSGLGDCTTEELCKLLEGKMVQSCLNKLLEILYELLCSYHYMEQWHKAGLDQQHKAAAVASIKRSSADSSSGDKDAGSDSSAEPATPSQAQLEQVQAATQSLLEAVAAGLADSRAAILDVAGARVKELLSAASKCKNDDYIKVSSSKQQCNQPLQTGLPAQHHSIMMYILQAHGVIIQYIRSSPSQPRQLHWNLQHPVNLGQDSL